MYWSDTDEYNPSGGRTGFDSQVTKLPTYWNTSFSKICLGMKAGGGKTRFTVINKQANSLYSLIADGQYRATSLGRNTWLALAGSRASLQPKCNSEGFNAPSYISSTLKTRIGILGNGEQHCHTCDSAIGFGNVVNAKTCGDVLYVRAMCYIFVQ